MYKYLLILALPVTVSASDSIVGMWEVTSENNATGVIEFRADGTCATYKNGQQVRPEAVCEYRLSGDTLHIQGNHRGQSASSTSSIERNGDLIVVTTGEKKNRLRKIPESN